MKKNLFFIFLVDCLKLTAQTWQSAPFYLGGERDDAVGFSIGNSGYVGTGRDAGFQYRSDFYQFQDNQWIPIASLLGIERQYACSFSLNQMGCVLTGIAPNDSLLNEMQCYDPAENLWSIKSAFPGAPRIQASSFSIGNYGFCGGGRNLTTDFNDWYCYNAFTNSWNGISPYPKACHESVAFSINGIGYVGLGKSLSNTYYAYFYSYNPITNEWKALASFPGTLRTYATAFAIGEMGYVVTGQDENGTFSNEYWQYNPQTNSWKQLTDFPFETKRGVAHFTIDNCAHIVTGLDENFQRLNTHQTYCVEQTDTTSPLCLYPNPSTGVFALQVKGEQTITSISILNLLGKLVYQNELSTNYYLLDLSCLDIGCYIIHVNLNSGASIVKKLVVNG
jgi:N-acetylneuraminic acid mutarotase